MQQYICETLLVVHTHVANAHCWLRRSGGGGGGGVVARQRQRQQQQHCNGVSLDTNGSNESLITSDEAR